MVFKLQRYTMYSRNNKVQVRMVFSNQKMIISFVIVKKGEWSHAL